ncbi:RING-type E3 ubiquitin transferase hel2 [Hyphodiscus hymeniophilus]|uniref:RING-type E3 ubiquitin transferase n=1 Tax=Hyphodiscus hymeniophilus TaxID=353542 RepID=A0A9P6VNL2_9HELO|nr:RING-type E3 ubiquitin transferase hel2 [Hyphodiscus hymeniophilus]
MDAAPSSVPSGSSPLRTRGDGSRGGRGRGPRRGRGGSLQENQSRGDRQPENQHRGGRRGGRGGNRGAFGAETEQNNLNAMDRLSLLPQIKPRPTLEKSEDKDGEEEVEAEVCFICASPVVHNAVAPCNHRTCHICALRMRALYKTKDCAHCRTPAEFVIFTDDATKRYEDFTDNDIASTDTNNGIRYEKSEIMEDTVLLLRYNCPDGDCDVACLGWPDLHRHVRAIHHKRICDLCSRHKKVFTHEHELFTDKELDKHMKKGDDNPGAVDQSGFKGHPECGFCRKRFYGEDELYVHCREAHERCFICDRRDGGRPQYYVNYPALEMHFRKDHFPCLDARCQEQKFVVFPTQLDLKAHQLSEHGDTMSKDVRRDARVVDMAGFNYRDFYVAEPRVGGSLREQREGRGRGRGRDPNTDAIPASSAQPLRRDEQAFQRQLAISSAPGESARTFGGQLTSAPIPAAARPPPDARSPPSVTVPQPTSDVAELTPQEQARQLRHGAVIERAQILLQHDQSKLGQFRNHISSFKNNSITATVLINSFFALFSDTSSTALGTLIREVADLYEDKSKADALRTAWNDWRAINEDYPSLPGPSVSSGSIPLGWAQTSSSSSTQSGAPKTSRVLKLKSSTAASSRSSVSQTRSWGTASSVASPLNPFPGLPPPSSAPPNNRTGTGKVNTIPWAPSSAVSSTPNSTPTSRPASTGPGRGRGTDMFPALPPAPKPQSTIFGYGSGMVRRDGLGGSGKAPSSPWGASGSNGGSGAASEAEGGAEDAGKGKKKGNKGKKQVLMNWG